MAWSRRVAAAFCLAATAAAPEVQAEEPALRLRVVGGFGSVHQYQRHEEPFWSRRLAELSGGRYTAQIVPVERAGLRGNEMLQLVELGAVPFGTLLLGLAGGKDALLTAPDLAGLNPDAETLSRSLSAFRPLLEARLRERHGVELLALYVYPAQVLWCREPFDSLAALKGRRVRTSSISQADWIEGLGATPVTTPFADIVPQLRARNVDCAITGSMTGNTLGLHEMTRALHPASVSWGVAAFVANGAAWRALPADLRALLQRELPRLEREVWDESIAETEDGIRCSVGGPRCRGGRPGTMSLVPLTPADANRRRALFAEVVLPRWAARCGPGCAEDWNRTLGPISGAMLPTR